MSYTKERRAVEPKDALKALRQQRREMMHLTNCVMLALADLDDKVGPRKDVPHDLSVWFAGWANALDMVNDRMRYSNGVDFRTDNKSKAIERLRAKLGRGDSR